MSAVVIKLIGGLGNQMFQYAAARALALRTGAQLELDLSWFGTDPDRQYALGAFAIQAGLRKSPNGLSNSNGLLAHVLRRLRLVRETSGVPVFREASFLYDAHFEKISPPVFLDGYFQSEKYFASVARQISAEFTVQEAPSPAAARILEQIAVTDAVCLHIRRGDYVKNPAANAYHGTCALDYYRAGLAHVAQDLKQPYCFVFSDDPSWVRENFKPDLPMTLVDIHRTDQAHEDLRLMAACQRYVIANSSLSWWGAWLGSGEGKKVVAPLRWFQNSSHDTSDLIPSTWHRL